MSADLEPKKEVSFLTIEYKKNPIQGLLLSNNLAITVSNGQIEDWIRKYEEMKDMTNPVK